MMRPRSFNPAEDTLIREAHAGQIHMRDLARALRTSYGAIYRRMNELGLSRRKPDARRRDAA
jgi:hypothetical protein